MSLLSMISFDEFCQRQDGGCSLQWCKSAPSIIGDILLLSSPLTEKAHKVFQTSLSGLPTTAKMYIVPSRSCHLKSSMTITHPGSFFGVFLGFYKVEYDEKWLLSELCSHSNWPTTSETLCQLFAVSCSPSCWLWTKRPRNTGDTARMTHPARPNSCCCQYRRTQKITKYRGCFMMRMGVTVDDCLAHQLHGA